MLIIARSHKGVWWKRRNNQQIAKKESKVALIRPAALGANIDAQVVVSGVVE